MALLYLNNVNGGNDMANAPGKSDRKGISLSKLFKIFPDNEAAETWFVQQRWGDKPACPHCGSINVQTGCNHKTMPYRCREKECAKRFSVKIGTVMQSSNLGYQTWAIAIYLLTTSLKSVSSLKLHRDLDITQKSAWHLAHRIRTSFDSAKPALMSGPVEVDETYFGGKARNMRASKRKAIEGRGTVGKTAVVGVKDRSTKRVSAKVVEHTDSKTLIPFIESHAEFGATVYTDDATAYNSLSNLLNGYRHESVKHSVSEYVRDQAHTNGIESFWSMLKRAHKGTFHNISPKHLGRYVEEFAGRQNVRELDTIQQMEHIAGGLLDKRLRYVDLVA